MPEPTHGAAHRLVRMVGRVPFDRALSLPMGRRLPILTSAREGEKAVQRRPAVGGPANQTALEEGQRLHSDIITGLLGKRRESKLLPVLRIRLDLLERLGRAGVRPDPIQLAAALAFEHGLQRDRLRPALNAAHMAHRYTGGALSRGTFIPILAAVNMNLPFKVHQKLHETPRVLTPQELLRELGLKPGPANMTRVNTTLRLLDYMGLTYRLPPDRPVEPRSGPEPIRRIHACYKFNPLTLSPGNPDVQLLRHLGDGPNTIRNIKTSLLSGGKAPRGPLAYSTVRKALTRLEKGGLIERRVADPHTTAFALSDYGRYVISSQQGLPFLKPTLRRVLMGEGTEPKRPRRRDHQLIDDIVRWSRVRQRARQLSSMESGDFDSRVASVSDDLNYPASFVRRVMKGNVPWKSAGLRGLLEVHLPRLRQLHPGIADEVEDKTINPILGSLERWAMVRMAANEKRAEGTPAFVTPPRRQATPKIETFNDAFDNNKFWRLSSLEAPLNAAIGSLGSRSDENTVAEQVTLTYLQRLSRWLRVHRAIQAERKQNRRLERNDAVTRVSDRLSEPASFVQKVFSRHVPKQPLKVRETLLAFAKRYPTLPAPRGRSLHTLNLHIARLGRYERALPALKSLREYESEQRVTEQAKVIAEHLRMKPGTVRRELKSTPWRRIGIQQTLKHFIPRLRQTRPDIAEFLEKELTRETKSRLKERNRRR